MKLYIRQVLDNHFSETKIDRDLCKRIIDYTTAFINKNENHIAFYGGVLMGVYDLKFLPEDQELWYEEVLQIDEDLLKADFIKCHNIEPTHVVGSEPFNYIPAYLSLRLNKANGIPNNLKTEAQYCLFVVMHSRFMGSLLSRRFNRYPANKAAMEEAFMALNYKFDIKTLGSWERLFRDRARSVLFDNRDFNNYMMDRYNDPEKADYWAKRIVSDLQTRLRELVNKYYQVYVDILKTGTRVRVTSSTGINSDGEMILRDKTTGYSNYLNYIRSVVTDQSSFIRMELIKITEELLPNLNTVHFIRSLEYISKNYNFEYDLINDFMDNSVIYVFNTMQNEKKSIDRTNDIKAIMLAIRAKLMAPKNKEPEILKIRELGERIAHTATGIRNPAVLSTVRSGLMLYVALRTMTKNYYSR